ncbi:hypothetical protein OPV22_031671 [Ensete ventricosum]|uniref:Uncharacterized protein n=1 Tax=Ensete ventricosum TaxID=4639 RepID=A0AAV8PV67_ENSVE|nr:hypothetical protein OPV22_031671 [Ensete ventricosum]
MSVPRLSATADLTLSTPPARLIETNQESKQLCSPRKYVAIRRIGGLLRPEGGLLREEWWNLHLLPSKHQVQKWSAGRESRDHLNLIRARRGIPVLMFPTR